MTLYDLCSLFLYYLLTAIHAGHRPQHAGELPVTASSVVPVPHLTWQPQQYADGAHCFKPVTLNFEGKTVHATVADRVCIFHYYSTNLPLTEPFLLVHRVSLRSYRPNERIVQGLGGSRS
jgi:hypothetical protein